MSTLLAVDTSTRTQSVALAIDGVIVASLVHPRDGRHSRNLAATLAALLDEHKLTWESLDGAVVDVGPGSFTGLRVGLALLKGVAAVTGLPVIPVRSVDAIAASFEGDAPVAVAFDAFNTQVYAAAVTPRTSDTDLLPLKTWGPVSWREAASALPEGTRYAGAGWSAYPELAEVVGTSLDALVPSAEGALRWALATGAEGVPAESVEPLYIRRSAAEERRDPRPGTDNG